jgi:hypothetical protein
VPPTTGLAAASRNRPTDRAGATPTTTQATTSRSTGARIHLGGSCGTRGRARGAGPKKAPAVKRREYATLPMPARVAAIGSVHSMSGFATTSTVSAKNISFERNPLRSGTPAIAALATIASAAVIGIARRRPESRRRSRVPVS